MGRGPRRVDPRGFNFAALAKERERRAMSMHDDDAVIAEAMSYIGGGGGASPPPPSAAEPSPSPMLAQPPAQYPPHPAPSAPYPSQASSATMQSFVSGALSDLVNDLKLGVIILVGYMAVSMTPMSELLDAMLPASIASFPLIDTICKGSLLALAVVLLHRWHKQA